MQCASCHFENMPGVNVCGQCGANMQLGAAAIDINPPRAGAWKKHLRIWLPLRGILYGWKNYFISLSTEFVPRFIPECSSLPILLRMIVPGWPQMAMERRTLGRTMLGLYLCMLLLTLLFFGSGPGGIFFGLAIAIHASSIIDVVWCGMRNYRQRVLPAFFCMIAVGALCYFPVIAGINQIIVPRNILANYGQFQQGDVFIYSPASYWRREPAVGDVVFYNIEPLGYALGGGRAHIEYRIEGGESIDRIIAREGQTVEWKNQQLRVNGQSSQWQPINPINVITNLKLIVPAGYYFILPSTQPIIQPNLPEGVFQRICLVPRHSILGRVIVRNFPFTRWWWIR